MNYHMFNEPSLKEMNSFRHMVDEDAMLAEHAAYDSHDGVTFGCNADPQEPTADEWNDVHTQRVAARALAAQRHPYMAYLRATGPA